MPKLHVCDIDIHYEAVGKGKPLVFIHGLGSSSKDWELQIPAFSNSYKVITFRKRFFLLRVMGIQRMAQFLGTRLFPKPEQQQLRQVAIERLALNDKQAYLNTFRALVGWSVLDRLSTINCPTLVIAADKDFAPMARKEVTVTKIPNAKLVVIDDSRHATPMEHPDKFNSVLMEFLSGQD